MKRILCIILLMYVSRTYLVGQSEKPISKGHFFAGGIIGYDSKRIDATLDEITISQRINSLELSPNFGFFLINRMALGLKANSIFTKTRYLSTNDLNKERKLLLSPFIRYYVYSDFFGELDLGYGKVKYEEETGTILRGLFSIGYSMFLNDKISLEPILSLSRYKENWKNNFLSDNKQTTISFSVSLQAFF